MASRRGPNGRTIVSLTGVALLILLLAGAVPGWRAGAHAQPGAAATATRQAEQAELARLRTEVAGRATDTPGTVSDPLGGRLGGTREGFDAIYGAPVRYLSDDQLDFQVDGFGQTVVTFADDRAQLIVLAPPRPSAKSIREADPADWSVAAAREAANRFLPADAIWEPLPAPLNGEATASGHSAALAVAIDPAIGACAGAADPSFTARLTMPTDRTVSLLTLELELVPVRASTLSQPTTVPAVATSGAGDGSTSVNVSIGGASGEDGAPGADGTVTGGSGGQGGQGGDGGQGGAAASVNINVSGGSEASSTANGIRVRLLGQQRNATGVAAPPAGTTYFALDVAIENRSRNVLRFDLADFRLTDTDGREHAAACGGPDPAIANGESAMDQTVRGWIAFAVPNGAEPARFTYEIEPGVTVSFGLT